MTLEIHNWLSHGHAKVVNVQKSNLYKEKLNGFRNQNNYLNDFLNIFYSTYKQHIFTKANVCTEKRSNDAFFRLECLFLVFLDCS